MPRVPTVIPRRAIPVAPGVRQSAAGASAAAFGGGVGSALQQFGQVGIKAANALERREQEDLAEKRVARAQEQYNNYRRDASALLRDEKDGLLFKKGKDAIGGADFFAEQNAALKAKYSADLDESERRLFDRAHTSFSRPALSSLQSHEANQTHVYKQAQNQDMHDGAVADAMENYNDPEARLEAEARILGAIRNSAKLAGKDVTKEDGSPSEFVEKKMLLATTKIYQEGIARYLANEEPEEAQKLFKENQHKIHPASRDELIKTLRAATLSKRTQRDVDNLFAKYGVDGEGAAGRWIRSNRSGIARDQLLDRANARWAQARRIKGQEQAKQLKSYKTAMLDMDEDEAMHLASKITNVEHRLALENFIDGRFNRRQRANERERKGLLEEVSDLVSNPDVSFAIKQQFVNKLPGFARQSAQQILIQDVNNQTSLSSAEEKGFRTEALIAIPKAATREDALQIVEDIIPEEFPNSRAQLNTYVSDLFAPVDDPVTPTSLSNFRTIKNNISESFIQTLPSLKPYANRQELEIAMADARIPNSMIPKLQQAWEEGGSLAKIKEDDILGILKSKGLEPKDYVGIVDNVRRNFPSDRSINETSLTEAVDKQLQLGHTSTGSGWVNYFFGDDELTRFEAEKAGRLAGFLPTLEDGDGNRTPQAKQAELIIRDLIANDPKFSGIKITPRMIQLYMLEADFGEAPGATLNEVREALPEAFRRR